MSGDASSITISTTLDREIVLGNGVYPSLLTISSTGCISAPAPNTSLQAASAVYTEISNCSIDNLGVIVGAISSTDSYIAPAIFSHSPLTLTNASTITGQGGVYLNDGGTITNRGTISGLDVETLHGYGVKLPWAKLINSGDIYGANYGVALFDGGEIVNEGEINGGIGGIKLFPVYSSTLNTLTNGGLIEGGTFGVTGASALITNTGTIEGQSYGVLDFWGGAITNDGKIIAAINGVMLLNTKYQAVYDTKFTNSGTVLGGYCAVELNSAVVTNAPSGVIDGGSYGAWVGDQGTLYNLGKISASNSGLAVETGGMATNAAAISGTNLGVNLFYGSWMTNATAGVVYSKNTAALDQAAYFFNAGSVVGRTIGAEVLGGALENSGSISGGLDGIWLADGQVTNSGVISGSQDAIYGSSFVLTVDPGAVFKGDVVDNSNTGELNLGGSTAGTLTGLGTQFNGFETIDFEAGGALADIWPLGGA